MWTPRISTGARAAEAAIEAEGAIQPDRLAKLVASAFDLTRVNDDRKRAIWRTIPVEFKPAHGDGFYWPRGSDPAKWAVAGVPATGQSRPLDEISLMEIANAIHIVAEESGGMTEEDIKLAALNLFGGRRRTDSVRGRLTQAMAYALKKGILQPGENGIYRAALR